VRIAGLGWLFVPALFLRLTMELLEFRPRLGPPALFLALYGPGLALLPLLWFTRLVDERMVKQTWGYAYETGPAFYIFLAHTCAAVLVAFTLMARSYLRATTTEDRRRGAWLLSAFVVPASVALVSDGLLPAFDIQLVRLGTSALIVSGVLTFAAAWRRRVPLVAAGSVAAGIVDLLPEGVVLIGSDGRIDYINPAARRLLLPPEGAGPPPALAGVDAEAGLGREIARVAREAERAGAAVVERTVTRAGPDGHELALGVSAAAVKEREEDAVVLVLRDVREARRLERRHFQAEKLQALSLLLSGFAHEMNNPLTGVMGYAELLLTDPALPDRMREDVKAILEGGTRCKRIVQNLLHFARQEKPEVRPVDLGRIARDAADFFATRLKIDTIALELHLAPELPRVLGDAHQLTQVFIHVIANASQAIREAKRGSRVRISARTSDGKVLVEIANDGPPIPPDVMGRIFDPFFTTKPVGEGTGLGLSVTYGVVAAHGGEISVRSDERETAFTIELPAITSASGGPASSDSWPPVTDPMHVLVVDDEDSVRQVVRRMLEHRGHRVDEAPDGREGLARLTGTGVSSYDLILLDGRMPNLSGSELYRRAVAIDGSFQQRVLFMTGDVSDVQTQDLIRESGAPFIAKPFSREDLDRALAAWAMRRGG